MKVKRFRNESINSALTSHAFKMLNVCEVQQCTNELTV